MLDNLKNVAKSYLYVGIGLVGILYGIALLPLAIASKLHNKLIKM